MRFAWNIRADGGIPRRRTPIATIFSATVTASSIPAPSAAWKTRLRCFTRRYSDHFRNRLTHTIEVAQISRTIAAQLRLNVDLVESLALVHDLGHPPFGHAGEKALDAAMREHGDFFDHNLHALRIVEDFELRYAAFRGLNLTFEVREGIIKHSRDWNARQFPALEEYLLDRQPPLEAQLIDFTDEIAYGTADLDDGYEAHILSLDQIRRGIPVFERLYAEADQAYPDVREKLKFNEALKRLLDMLVTDLITSTAARVTDAGVMSVDDVRDIPRAAGRLQPGRGRPPPPAQGVPLLQPVFQPGAGERENRCRAGRP